MNDFLTIALLCINIIVAALLIGAVLLQKSEGGALGMGGGPANFMSARGTGDLLTRITWILFAVFLTISVTLTLLGAAHRPATGSNIRVDPAELLKSKAPASAPANPGSPAFDPSFGAAPTQKAPASGGLIQTPPPAQPEKK